MRLSRTSFRALALAAIVALAAVALGACGGDDEDEATEGAASEPTKLDIQGVWVAGDTSLAGVWLADENGYFDQRNVEVDVAPGGDVDPTQIVLSGSKDAGINSASSLLAAREKGAPVKIVGCEMQRSPLAIVAHGDAGIQEFSDLRGKRIGVDTFNEPLLEAFLLANDITTDDVDIVTIAPGLGQLLAGRIDAQLAFATNEPLILERRGVPYEVFLAADNNFVLPDYCFFTTEKGVSEHGEAIRAFFAGTTQGWEDVTDDPATGADVVVGLQEGTEKDQVTEELTELTEGFLIDPNDSRPLFNVPPEQFDTLSEQLVASGFLDKEVSGSEILAPELMPESS